MEPKRQPQLRLDGEVSLVATRLQKAEQYLSVLESALKMEWQNFFLIAKTHPDWIYRLAAIHPKHYEDYVSIEGDFCPIRGPRHMPIDGGAKVQGCQSSLIWGYKCHFANSHLEADHLFPYSFGGPSIGQNKVFLCTMHNHAKAADVHLFPWEKGEPVWLSDILERIRRNLNC